MTDPAMSTIMWQIAAGYRLLAQHAERRDAGEAPQAITGISYGPETLATIGQAFNMAWAQIAPTAGTDPAEIEAARLELANAVLSVASEDARDARVLRDGALAALTLASRPRR